MKLTFLVFFALASRFGFSVGFEYQFINYSVNEGLPSAQIYEMLQDDKGYIWIGTDRGLVRFNGYEFKVFSVNDGLSTNVIFKLDLDAQGRVCCYGKDRKIHILKENRFVEFKYNSLFRDLHSPRSNLLSFDFSAESFSFGLSDVTDGMSPMGKLNFNGEVQLEKRPGIYLNTQNRGSIGILNVDSLDLFITSVYVNGEFERMQFVNNPSEGVFADIATDGERVYFSIYNILYQYSMNGDTSINMIHQFSNEILDLKLDEEGNLFVGVRNAGLWKMNVANNTNLICLLPDVSVSNVLIDNQAGVWAATLFNGIYYWSHQEAKKLRNDREDEINRMMSFGDEIYAITKLNQLIKIDFHDSLNSIDRHFKLISPQVITESNKNRATYNSELFPIGVFWDQQTDNYCSYQFSTRDQFIHDEMYYLAFRATIRGLTEDLIIADAIQYNYEYTISCGMGDFSGALILGTENGVRYQLPNESNRMKVEYHDFYNHYTTLEPYHHHIPFFRTNVRDMLNVNDSLLIFGSAEKGLYIQQMEGSDIWLRASDGLVSDIIDRIYVKDDLLLVITKAGISLVRKDLSIKNYTVKNGLLSNNVTDALIRNDELWVATDEGTSVIDLNKRDKPDFPIYLSSCKIDGNSQLMDTSYCIGFKNDFLEVSFEGLSFAQKGEIRYKYQLKGVDKTWISTLSTTARYVNIPFGEFEFWICAQKGDQSWTEPICLFRLEKVKPFWISNWFLIIIIMLLLGLIWLGFNIRFQRLRRLQEDKYVMLNMERKTLQAQMHPHFVFNSLTSLQSLIVDDRKLESQEFLAKFSKLTRLALNHSTKNLISLEEEIQVLRHYIELEQVRYANKFEYQIYSMLDNNEIEIPPMLIQPFVENAIKHGFSNKEKNGLLTVSFEKRDHLTFSCVVNDNGLGRANKKNSLDRTSLGIKLVSERLVILLSDLNVKEDAIQIKDLMDGDYPIGTRVTIILPIKKKYV